MNAERKIANAASHKRRHVRALDTDAEHDFPSILYAPETGIVRIRNFVALTSDDTYIAVDLGECLTPKSPFASRPEPITNRKSLTDVIVGVLKQQSKVRKKSKSFHITLSALPLKISKIVEFGWLNGAYKLSDWTPELVEQLAAELASGGWAKALRIEERALEFVSPLSEDQAFAYLSGLDKIRRHKYGLRVEVRMQLGTNASQGELFPALCAIVKRANVSLDQPDEVSKDYRKGTWEKGMSASQLSTDMSVLNLLCDVDCDDKLLFTPFPYLEVQSKSAGRQKQPTPALPPEELGALLVEAHHWIYKCSEPIIALLREILEALEKKRYSDPSNNSGLVKQIIKKSIQSLRITELLGVRVVKSRGLDPKGSDVSLDLLVRSLMSGCFLVISLVNARRKDEVQHKRIGLRSDSLSVIDESLKVYECEFYIEKTFQTFIPFYVSSMTVAAIGVLQQSSSLARAFVNFASQSIASGSDVNRAGLFQVPKIYTLGKRARITWFNFDTSVLGGSRYFVRRALGHVKVRAHMLRKSYALLYHYRYENSSLLALKQQLGHDDLASVLTYAGGGPDGKLFARLTPSQRSAVEADAAEIMDDLEEAGRDRVTLLVREVLEGQKRFSGSFSRLVQRWHQRFGKRFDYAELALAKQAEVLARIVVQRGHLSEPFPHSNCCASAKKPNGSARCFSEATQSTAREHASIETCNGCAYQHVEAGHITSMRFQVQQAEMDSRRLGPESIAGRRLGAEIHNMRRIIALHVSRIHPDRT